MSDVDSEAQGVLTNPWVPILIVETEVHDIGWLLFRERFGLADDEPAFEAVSVLRCFMA
ncbi:MAG: hypothetical protein GY822_23785 [Deltaproteobacteria bacterium]|nr:hypothetical protein [Deltaproteobacteria bacterium]